MIPMERISARERRLLKILRTLEAQDRATLMAFGEFLLAGGARVDAAGGESPSVAAPPNAPRHEPRPPDESPIAAIKRLRRVYPMLDAGEMLHETSALMAEHVLRGREAGEVIDELERLFVTHYENQHRNPRPGGCGEPESALDSEPASGPESDTGADQDARSL